MGINKLIGAQLKMRQAQTVAEAMPTITKKEYKFPKIVIGKNHYTMES